MLQELLLLVAEGILRCDLKLIHGFPIPTRLSTVLLVGALTTKLIDIILLCELQAAAQARASAVSRSLRKRKALAENA